MKKVCLLAGVVWLVGVGSAGGWNRYEPGPAMTRWQNIAAERFPDACEPVALWTETPDYLLSNIASAAGPSLGVCQIVFSARFFALSRERRCALVVHEYGHLAGLHHSTDPFSIMYPEPSVLGARRCSHPRRWG